MYFIFRRSGIAFDQNQLVDRWCRDVLNQWVVITEAVKIDGFLLEWFDVDVLVTLQLNILKGCISIRKLVHVEGFSNQLRQGYAANLVATRDDAEIRTFNILPHAK